jgi:hypothetical protein
VSNLIKLFRGALTGTFEAHLLPADERETSRCSTSCPPLLTPFFVSFVRLPIHHRYDSFLSDLRKALPDPPLTKKDKAARLEAASLASSSPFDYNAKVQHGSFGSMMDVASVNDGPVTIVIDSREEGGPSFGDEEEEEVVDASSLSLAEGVAAAD